MFARIPLWRNGRRDEGGVRMHGRKWEEEARNEDGIKQLLIRESERATGRQTESVCLHPPPVSTECTRLIS